jgi:hypothetical protein
MQKFEIEQSIKKIDDYFYCVFSPAANEYKDKAQSCLSVKDLNIDTEAIRQNLFIILDEMYINFKNDFYL